MKLSEKALKKIQDEMEHGEYQIPCGYENVEGMSIYHLEEHEFEPEDFTDTVVLTVNEAKEIAVTMFVYHELCQKFLIGNDYFVIKASKVSHNLDKKIEKAEGK